MFSHLADLWLSLRGHQGWGKGQGHRQPGGEVHLPNPHRGTTLSSPLSLAASRGGGGLCACPQRPTPAPGHLQLPPNVSGVRERWRGRSAPRFLQSVQREVGASRDWARHLQGEGAGAGASRGSEGTCWGRVLGRGRPGAGKAPAGEGAGARTWVAKRSHACHSRVPERARPPGARDAPRRGRAAPPLRAGQGVGAEDKAGAGRREGRGPFSTRVALSRACRPGPWHVGT